MEALLSFTLLIVYNFETYSCIIIIDIDGNHLVLSAKHSLINLAQQLPLNNSQIHPNSVVHVSS